MGSKVGGLAVSVIVARGMHWRTALVLAVVALCAGCGFGEGKEEAEQAAEQYCASAKGEDLEGVLSLYSERFFAATSRDQWRKFLEDQRSRCGTPQSHSLVNWNVFSSIGSNSGTRTTLVYDVKYSSCQVLETITFFKPSAGKIQIQAHFMKLKERPENAPGDSRPIYKT